VRWFTFDLLTGDKLRYLPTTTGGRWSGDLNAAGGLSCRVPLTVGTADLNLRESARPVRTGLACLEGDHVLQAGPIWARNYARDEAGNPVLDLVGAGIWSWFDKRVVMPQLWEAITVAGAIDAEDPDWALVFESESFSNIVKGLAAEVMSWEASDLPIVLPDDTAGSHDKTYYGYDLGWAGQRFREITELEGGPEIRFRPRFTSSRQGLEWLLEVGTDADPELHSVNELRWNAGAEDSPIRNLSIDEDATGIASLGWGLGGRQSDETILVKTEDAFLTDRGFPLVEMVDNDHSTVTLPATLDAYLAEGLLRARRGSELWSLQIRKDRPPVGSYAVGDHVSLKVKGDPYIPDGRYSLKIVHLSGDDSDFVTVRLVTRGV